MPEPLDSPRTLVDSEIVPVTPERRTFLTKVALGATGLLAAVLTSACTADPCDHDVQTDIDVRDPINRPHDRCDSDGR
jgi:hypothetical protein